MSLLLKQITLLFLIMLLCTTTIFGVETKTGESKDVFKYEEVPLTVRMGRSWSFDIWVLMTENGNYFIPIKELFKSLDIQYISNTTTNSASGFIERENRQFLIDFNELTIRLDGVTHQLNKELLLEMGEFYIDKTSLDEIFGIETSFKIRNLSLIINAKFELPRFKEMRLEEMRRNIDRLQGNVFRPDTIIPRERHIFRAGMLDWGVSALQTTNRTFRNSLQLDWGSEFLFGKTNVGVVLSDQSKFTPQGLYYNWHWVKNENKFIRQVRLGKFNGNEIGIHKSVIGGQITNRSTNVRKASGSYEHSGQTSSNWIVELYINNRLVDFTVADASGFYTFTVPIVYGSTSINVKAYGPSGEEQVQNQSVKTPHSLMLKNSFEYNIAGGIFPTYTSRTGDSLTEGYAYLKRDNLKNSPQYGIADFLYGVTRKLTIGGGVEAASSLDAFKYSQSPIKGMFVPFGNLSFQPFSKLYMSGYYYHNSRAGGAMNSNLPASINLGLGYNRTLLNYPLEESINIDSKSVKLSKSYGRDRVSGSIRGTYANSAFSNGNYGHTFDGSFSNSIDRLNASISLNAHKNGIISTKRGLLSLSYGLGSATLGVSGYFDLDSSTVTLVTTRLSAPIGKGRFSANYSRYISSRSNSASLTYSLDFNVIQTRVNSSFSGNRDNMLATFRESVNGSMAFAGDRHIKMNNRQAVDRAGITFYPYFDNNYNSKHDKDERFVNVPILSKKNYRTTTDSISRIGLLNVNTKHEVEFNNDDLDYLSWQFPYKKFEIEVDPNQYKRVYVPIHVYGEVTGTISKVRHWKDPLPFDAKKDTTLDIFVNDGPNPNPAILEILNYDSNKAVEYAKTFEKYKYLIDFNPDAKILINTPKDKFREPDGVIGHFIKSEIYKLHVARTKVWAQNIKKYLVDVYDIPSKNIEISRKRNKDLHSDPLFMKFRGKIISLSITNADKMLAGGEVNTNDTYETILRKSVLPKIGRGLIVEIWTKEGEKVAETETESDGYFSYLGLKPGEYFVKLSDSQLKELGMQQYPENRPMTINVSEDGDYIEDMNFIVIDKKTIEEE
jgi:hypothetical protein